MTISKKRRFQVFQRDGFQCQYCGRRSPDVPLELDHKLPRSRGGDDTIENLLTACKDCNNGKGETLLAEDVFFVTAVERFVQNPALYDDPDWWRKPAC